MVNGNNVTWQFLCRALRLTDQKWQEHLKRFDILEARAADPYGNDIPHLGHLANSAKYSPKIPRSSSIQMSSPPQVKRYHSDEQLNIGSPIKSLIDSDDSDEEYRQKEVLTSRSATMKNGR